MKFRGDWYPLMEPRPGLFSFNSPLGACPECRGYGRVITVDYNRCIKPELSVRDRAIHIFEGEGKVFSECKKDLMRAWRKSSPAGASGRALEGFEAVGTGLADVWRRQ